jgi:hypothetical protein
MMRPAAVTAALVHDLTAGSHTEGITTLGVEAAIEHHDAVLLIAEPGPDFTDETWQLPAGRYCPARPYRRPAPRRHGHRADHRPDHRIPRPPRPSRRPGHHPGIPLRRHRHRSRRHLPPRRDRPPLGRQPGQPGSRPGRPPRHDAHVRGRGTAARWPLRAWAHGIYPDEAGMELLIGHASFLHRADFTSRFISIPGDGAGLAVIDWPPAYREPPRRPHQHRRPRHPTGAPGSPAHFRTPPAIGIS